MVRLNTSFFFFFKQKTSYEIHSGLEFRRVLFRSGRPGYAHLGVPHAGAADRPSLCLANRLVGNPQGAAALEFTLGGTALRFHLGAWIAVTGAPAPLLVDGRPHGMNAVAYVSGGALVELGTPTSGVRSYLAVRGGLEVEPVLGSRSTDLLSHLGPPALRPGTGLPIGHPAPD